MVSRLLEQDTTTADHYISDDPDAFYPVPSAPAFIDAKGVLRDYAPAPDLADLADRLIVRHRLGSLHTAAGLRIAYAWKAAGGTDSGLAKLGACKKASATERFIAYHQAGDGAQPPDLLIWLAADYLTGQQVKVVEAALFHELLHAGRSSKGSPGVNPHDCEMFTAEVHVYGLWRDALRTADAAFRQASMPLDS
jgi:putative metallopeptidase